MKHSSPTSAAGILALVITTLALAAISGTRPHPEAELLERDDASYARTISGLEAAERALMMRGAGRRPGAAQQLGTGPREEMLSGAPRLHAWCQCAHGLCECNAPPRQAARAMAKRISLSMRCCVCGEQRVHLTYTDPVEPCSDCYECASQAAHPYLNPYGVKQPADLDPELEKPPQQQLVQYARARGAQGAGVRAGRRARFFARGEWPGRLTKGMQSLSELLMHHKKYEAPLPKQYTIIKETKIVSRTDPVVDAA